jgi:hypothetical protein
MSVSYALKALDNIKADLGQFDHAEHKFEAHFVSKFMGCWRRDF